ncbi:MAG: DUF1836 domain-containing protein [Acetatifactor sp.]|nr:DUF1836 domain-containing protein [Acetatifactor sp.]
MTINSEDLLNSILASLDRVDYINANDIPNIDMYMDQVTTFMDKRLRSSVRYPDEDKILTKTMINNYAKNNLLPPPEKKKYNKEHILIMLFIYYFKTVMSINDIQTLLNPLTDKFFGKDGDFTLEKLYTEAVNAEKDEIEALKKDITSKYKLSEQMFNDAAKQDAAFLQKFAFILLLAIDVYVKKLLIQKMVDEVAKDETLFADKKGRGKDREKDKAKTRDKDREKSK